MAALVGLPAPALQPPCSDHDKPEPAAKVTPFTPPTSTSPTLASQLTSPPTVPSTTTNWYKQPVFHLKAPRGWLNDPCAPGYDAATQTWHLFYQWNPASCDWGNIGWGHVTSSDGLRWTQRESEPVLRPDQAYDGKGIFTGCFWPSPRDDGQLTVLYSSACHLPIHWSLPYTRNCAGLSMAVSRDGGQTWTKDAGNPVLQGEPDGLRVTGFRDPFVGKWPAMARVCGDDEATTLYGILSGGVVGKGPNLFVYAVPADDPAAWTYLGPLADILVDACPPSHWTGDLGVNWECGNFVSLAAAGATEKNQDFLIFSTEGGFPRGEAEDSVPLDGVPLDDAARRSGNWTVWMAGRVQARPQKDATSAAWQPQYSGLLDCGSLYAPSTHEDPVTGERICWGWIREEQLSLARREERGWAGYLSLPRELFLLALPHVVGAWKTPLEAIPSIAVSRNEDGATVHTLGIRPARRLAGLGRGAPQEWTCPPASLLTTASSSSHWDMQATIRVLPGTRRVGFHIRHSPDLSQRVSIFWEPENESLVVDTRLANNEPDLPPLPNEVLCGPLTLFTFKDGDQETVETLRLHIFSDGDVLEVFANDRFALSTAVYGDHDVCRGISCFVEGDGRSSESIFESIKLWDVDSVWV